MIDRQTCLTYKSYLSDWDETDVRATMRENIQADRDVVLVHQDQRTINQPPQEEEDHNTGTQVTSHIHHPMSYIQ